ncbi:MAG: hypothetical protein ACKO7G_08270 [Gammaproteobacteria bacterium]
MVQDPSQMPPSSPGKPATKRPAAAATLVCINDGDALVHADRVSVLNGLPGRASAVHVVKDRVKRVIAIHDAKLETLRMDIAAPWLRMSAPGTAGLHGSRTVLEGDFERRLKREFAYHSWSISPLGARKDVSGRFRQIMERIGDCPPGISSAPIVPLPASAKPAPAP